MSKPIPSLRERWIKSIQAIHTWRGVEPVSTRSLSEEYDRITKRMGRRDQEVFVVSSEGHAIILNSGTKS